LGKNPAFEGYKSPNLDYRGKNSPVNKTIPEEETWIVLGTKDFL
jgi:hypothetical protein